MEAKGEDAYPDPHSHLTTLTAPSATDTSLMDMTPYGQATSAVSSYSLDLHASAGHQAHYYPDYDWQRGASSGAAADPSHGAFFSFSERPDLPAVQLYHHSFPSAVSHSDLYASSPALWHGQPGLVDDPNHVNALSTQRYLPSLSRTSGSSSSSSSNSSSNAITNGKPKRRRVQTTTQRKAANVRERRRMFHLNTAFDELRKRLPAFNYEKRLSRIETLRLAMTYIGFMKDVSMGQDPRKVKLRPGNSDAGSDLSHLDMESCSSDDPQHDDLES